LLLQSGIDELKNKGFNGISKGKRRNEREKLVIQTKKDPRAIRTCSCDGHAAAMCGVHFICCVGIQSVVAATPSPELNTTTAYIHRASYRFL